MENQPRLSSVQCLHPGGLHRLAYWEWGAPDLDDVVVCVHGLTRQGRDFDVLAQALQANRRVVCPDLPGRGESDWLANPALYQVPQYLADMVTLLARLNARRVSWVGTSLGGLIGIALAGMEHSPIARLVLNDVGPSLDPRGLMRIASYVGRQMRFDTPEQAADSLREISLGFGPHTPEQWMALTRPMLRPDGSGWRLHYDPALSQPFSAATAQAIAAGEVVLWQAFDQIAAPTLVVRGADSDILDAQTALAMTQRGPRARLVELSGVGHAPTLVQPDQVALVRDFLLS
ncbi:MAG: alpha/beta hydrolase [Thiomonas sp.]|uniref:alpha/beta fold hydrolase n=1 Tax=Thiomonas sp. TaxID=2047785 RepID=UPI002A3712B2|nr:alpha/beta hydrolase [Thiomonas sp.]MDY0329706.1 alpha/beta hydrolase [Thiomonas sp.]